MPNDFLIGNLHDDEPIVKVSISEYKTFLAELEQYPLEFMENYSVLKLREDDDAVHVGLGDPGDYALVENLQNFHQKRVIFHEIDKSELAAFLGNLLSHDSHAEDGDAVRHAVRHGELRDRKIFLDRLANDAPIVNLVNSILIEAIRKRASDIHIEAASRDVVIRNRIDGYLQIVDRIDKDRFAGIASRIKIMANLNIMERRLPQDGRITVHIGDDIIDVRVSIIPIVDGESIVLRLFSKKKTPLNLDQLGLEAQGLTTLREMYRVNHGLVLVTGPTGSGKTTSLNAILREIRSDAVKIITIEDPVEYLTEGIDQIQTNEKIGLTFDSILRRVLRQDPDIIMVGEIRDVQTAELAMRAALTGHLVFSTLHTKDSASVITRLRNMGIEPYLIAAVLRGSIAQRLVRRVCPECRVEVEPNKRERALLERYNLQNGRLYRGTGCRSCSGLGYRGRTGLFELFINDGKIEEMIVRNAKHAEIMHYVQSRGMKTLAEQGLAKALSGVTTISEVERVIAS
jgi:type II secretory ATPase GspE/PulE/Tfp pilus assembly ATPase PilB-like protein